MALVAGVSGRVSRSPMASSMAARRSASRTPWTRASGSAWAIEQLNRTRAGRRAVFNRVTLERNPGFIGPARRDVLPFMASDCGAVTVFGELEGRVEAGGDIADIGLAARGDDQPPRLDPGQPVDDDGLEGIDTIACGQLGLETA